PALAARRLPGRDAGVSAGDRARLPHHEHRPRPPDHRHLTRRRPVKLPGPPAVPLVALTYTTQTTRKPTRSSRWSGLRALREAERQSPPSLNHEPPRATR